MTRTHEYNYREVDAYLEGMDADTKARIDKILEFVKNNPAGACADAPAFAALFGTICIAYGELHRVAITKDMAIDFRRQFATDYHKYLTSLFADMDEMIG